MYICPHCNKPGIGYVRKIFIGLRFPATCKACGRKVHNNGLKAMLATLPIPVSWVVTEFFLDKSLFEWLLGIGVITMVLLTSFWVPLEKESKY